MRKISVLNQKGGVGKTTTVVNLAAALARMGKKVVAVDLDPQAHLTIHLGFDPESIEAGSYKVLLGSGKFEDELIEARENLWLLPANINLVGAESELVSIVGRELILKEAIAEIEDRFDYMIIDCAPSLGLLTLNALAATKEILIPLQPHFLALQGLGKLLETAELVNKRINPELRVKGVLLCMFDSRSSLPNEVKTDIEQFLESARGTNCSWAQARLVPAHIRRNIKLAEAPSYGKTIFEYEPECNGAEDYKQVAEFVENYMGKDFSGEVKAAVIKTEAPVPTQEAEAKVEEPEGKASEKPQEKIAESAEKVQQPENTAGLHKDGKVRVKGFSTDYRVTFGD